MRKQSCSRLWNLSHGHWFPWWLTVFRSDVWKIHENPAYLDDSPMKTWLKMVKNKKNMWMPYLMTP
jgi:hypothetical protein